MVKLLRMKNLNLVLALALLGLMYKTPLFLLDIANNVIGRAILVIALAYIVIRCDFSCAILFSLIIIVLFHNNVEGFIEGLDEEEIKEIADDTQTEIDEEGDAEGDDEGDAASDADNNTTGDKPEPFMGGMKKKLNNLRKVLKSNITDLDRELKVGAERRSISATKQ